MNSEYAVRLDGDLGPEEIGVKAARLAELATKGIRVPEGFAVTAAAYREFVRDGRLGPVVGREIRRFRAGRDLEAAAAAIRSAFRDAPVPQAVADEILAAYKELGGEGTEVAVRCSPVTTPDAVDHEVFLHLTTGADVVAACRRCFGSLYDTVAVGNREAAGIDQLKVVMPVTVQQLVRSDLVGSGTARGENTFVRVHATWGLGGPQASDADLYSVHPGARPLIVSHCGAKLTKIVSAEPRGTRTVPTTPDERAELVLSEDELRELAGWSVLADRHFRRPTTLDWAKDGLTGRLYVVEVRPGVPPAMTIGTPDQGVRVPQYR
ncbi:PEP/pyruvate-binding domain-containing protein [Kribbella sp. NPDC004875]|uniref:PEP/pyruvate-binding domain-containing protein n=1 Tax=Kribbella sp. NPDC004875 TaxID=3364107 RepID=UPI00369163E1